MTEEYDVFGDLDDLCTDKLENFKNTVLATAPLQNNISDDDLVLSDALLDSSSIAGSKHRSQDTPQENLNDVLELSSNTSSTSSKTKKKTRGKKTLNSDKDTLPSHGYGFSSMLAKRASPVKNPSLAKRALPTTENFLSLREDSSSPTQDFSSPTQDCSSPTQDFSSPTQDFSSLIQGLPPPTIQQAAPLRRLTRSMGKVVSSTEKQPTTNAPHVVVVPPASVTPAAVAPEFTQPQSARGRKSNRGRKRQTQTAMQNLALLQTLSQQVAQTVAPLQSSRRSTRRNPIQQMYTSRREYAALLAAQSSDVAYVDLVSSPVPRINGVINVDSDTEENTLTVETNKCLDASFDEENPEISVKVIWNGNPETFILRKYQKFATIFTTIAQREDTDETNLIFNINNKILSANDTPASINYKIFEFINGRVLVSKLNSPRRNEKKKREANKISLKIQSDQWKRPMQVELLKTEKFKILYIKCAEELNIPYENLKLSFDGESLEFDGTSADLELEGGEAIDLRVKK